MKLVNTFDTLVKKSPIPRLWVAHILNLVHHHRPLNLTNPIYFSDLVQSRMFLDRDENLIWACDKMAQKHRVSELRLGQIEIPETLWFGRDLNDAIDAKLEGRYVIKPNSDSSKVWFGEGPLNVGDVARINESLRCHSDPYEHSGEWAYSQAQQGFLIERLLGEPPLPDYKVHVFWGNAVFLFVCTDRNSDLKITCYDRNWNKLQRVWGNPVSDIPRPPMLAEMLAAAEKIADGFDFLRVDFYVVDDKLYFGETAAYPGSGRHVVRPDYDRWLGNLWNAGSVKAVRDLYPQIAQFHNPGNETFSTFDDL